MKNYCNQLLTNYGNLNNENTARATQCWVIFFFIANVNVFDAIANMYIRWSIIINTGHYSAFETITFENQWKIEDSLFAKCLMAGG